jgi:hypothetical protein
VIVHRHRAQAVGRKFDDAVEAVERRVACVVRLRCSQVELADAFLTRDASP